MSSTGPRFADTALSSGLARSVGVAGTSCSVSGGRMATLSPPGSLIGSSLDARTGDDLRAGDDFSAGAALGAYIARSPSNPAVMAVSRTDSQEPTCVLGKVTLYEAVPFWATLPK